MTPLCVDLDGTLIKSDSSFESFLLLIKKNPFYLFLVLIWLWQGRAYLKQKIADKVLPNPEHLPYNQNFLTFLQQEHLKGRELILVTGADQKIAQKVSTHLKIFSSVLASDGCINLTGHAKTKVLTAQFGSKGYDYAGNSSVDLPVWAEAREALIVNAKQFVIKKASKIANISHIFKSSTCSIRTFFKAIRLHQSIKNILVFIPLFVGHRDFDFTLLANTSLAFFCFCLFSSSVYLVNDLLDVETDRQHQIKQHRMFATGNLSMASGLILALVLFVAGLGFSLFLPSSFTVVLVFYYLIGLSYSFYFKQFFLLDVCILAVLYTLRIIAGMTVIGAGYSGWLILFAIFFFLSLAFLKRYSELYDVPQQQTSAKDLQTKLTGRNYLITDLTRIGLFGKLSGYISIFILAIYISTERAKILYVYPKLLWLICFLLMYWVYYVWSLATKGLMHYDPVLFVLKDKFSLAIGFIATCIVLIATFC